MFKKILKAFDLYSSKRVSTASYRRDYRDEECMKPTKRDLEILLAASKAK